MQGKMAISSKKRASAPHYVSPSQLTLSGFESPFERNLNPQNRWVVLSKLIPWDIICNTYLHHVPLSSTGRPPISPRVIIGALIIKHLGDLDDRDTIDQISENIYMQYFLGYPTFTDEPPFDASLFVEIRKRLGLDAINALNEQIVKLRTKQENLVKPSSSSSPDEPKQDQGPDEDQTNCQANNKGTVIMDATACPQNIAYPTDLNLLNDAREKTEELIDVLYRKALHGTKPRTYREIARKLYLKTAQKKNKSRKEIYKAVGSQLRLIKRNIRHLNELLDTYEGIPLKPKELKYLYVVQTLYQQQLEMHQNRTHSVSDRIVSIHQPHVRPIVRGKSQARVEFGTKIHASIVDGITFLDELSWDPFNEGSHMELYVAKYRDRFGYYPAELLADKIYCTRANRAMLKEKGVKLKAKPLGRPIASALKIQLSPGERNPIEGKFGQAKTAYGLGCIRARLKQTSETWIACIFLVLNLVKLAGIALLCQIISAVKSFSLQLEIIASKPRLENYCRNFIIDAA